MSVPGGPKLPATAASTSTGSGASKLPATRGGTVAATQSAPKAASSGFTYSRLGDTPLRSSSKVADIVSKASRVAPVVGRAAGLAAGAMVAKDVAKGLVPGAMNRTYNDTHQSMVPHASTPGVKTSDSFARMRQMGAKPAAAAPAPKAEPSSFKQAFAQARKEAGGGKGQFTYKDKQYQTNIAPAKGDEKYIAPSKQSVTSVGKASTAAPSTTTATPGSMKVSAQPAPSAASTAGMSSAAEKSGVPQTPAPSMKNDFAAGKDVSSTPVPTTSTAPAATPAPEVKASVSTAPEPAPAKAPEPEKTYSADSPAGKAWANRGKFGTQQENKMVAESFVTVGDNKYRIV